eukprot:7760566-Pyramimonas_sp.AAC.1
MMNGEGGGTGKVRRIREQASGFNRGVQNVLLDPQLDRIILPVDQYCHDWTRAFFIRGSDGLSDACSCFEECIGLRSLPRAHGGADNLAKPFQTGRETANGKAKAFKCQAREALPLVSLMYTYVIKVIFPTGVARMECVAFARLCGLVRCIEAAASCRASACTLKGRTDAF